MPQLPDADATLLSDLARKDVATIGRRRIKQLLALCWRCINGQKQAEEEACAQTFLANALWLAASGKLTEVMIAVQARLTPEQKGDCLALLQMRYDAEAWRAHCELDLPPLPVAVEADPEPIPA